MERSEIRDPGKLQRPRITLRSTRATGLVSFLPTDHDAGLLLDRLDRRGEIGLGAFSADHSLPQSPDGITFYRQNFD